MSIFGCPIQQVEVKMLGLPTPLATSWDKWPPPLFSSPFVLYEILCSSKFFATLHLDDVLEFLLVVGLKFNIITKLVNKYYRKIHWKIDDYFIFWSNFT